MHTYNIHDNNNIKIYLRLFQSMGIISIFLLKEYTFNNNFIFYICLKIYIYKIV